MTDTLDLSKTVITRGGSPVEIVSTNGREPLPIIGYIGKSNELYTWRRDGVFMETLNGLKLDLINVPEPKRSGEVWVEFYIQDGIQVASSVPYSSGLVARKLIPWTEGEGLEK